LRKLHHSRRELSPSLIVGVDSPYLTTVSYHAKVLFELGITRCTRVDGEGRRWSKRYYVSNVAKNELVEIILAETEEEDASLLASDGPFAPKRRKWATSA